MKRAVALAALGLLGLAGCTQTDDPGQAGTSATIAVQTPGLPEPAQSSPPRDTPAPSMTTPAAAPASSKVPQPAQTAAGDVSFCDYLARSADAAQQIEDPDAFVELVQGAVSVAPGSIREDVELYAQSVRKLAVTVTGSPAQAAKADAWLTRNDASVQQAQDNLNSYSLSTCGQPFITGEGN